MKKVFILILIVTLVFSLYSCTNKSSEDIEEISSVYSSDSEVTDSETNVVQEFVPGEIAATDLIEFTVNKAEYSIALHSGTAGDFEQVCLPKQYDPSKDNDPLYVAGKGHTKVGYQIFAKNLDRVSLEVAKTNQNNAPFITVEYNGVQYESKEVPWYKSKDGYEWNSSWDTMILDAQEELFFRGVIDIPIEVSDLSSDVIIIFNLPSSDGHINVKYHIKKEDNIRFDNKDISFEEALLHFNSDKGQRFFIKHLSEYQIMETSEIKTEIMGTWSGYFRILNDSINTFSFDKNQFHYKYKTTPTDINIKVSDDSITFLWSHGSETCLVYKVTDNTILLVSDGTPYAILYK